MVLILVWLAAAALLWAVAHVKLTHVLVRKRKGPWQWPLVGMLPSVLLNVEYLYDWVTFHVLTVSPSSSAASFEFRAPGLRSLITSDPRNVEHVLRTRFDNYPKGPCLRELFRDFLGRGIFNADHELWRMQRKAVSLEFHSRRFRQFAEDITHQLLHNKVLPLLASAAICGSPLDLQDVLLRFTLESVCLLNLGVRIGCLELIEDSSRAQLLLPAVPFAQAFENVVEATALRFLVPVWAWKLLGVLRLGSERRLHNSLQLINNFMADLIARRRREFHSQGQSTSSDLLSCFMGMQEEQHKKLHTEEGREGKTSLLGLHPADTGDGFLRDVALSLIIAGRDTSGVALAWFFWLLATHPEEETKVVEEIQAIQARRSPPATSQQSCCANVGRHLLCPCFTEQELSQMHYLHAALSETLRLYPPVPVDMKQAVSDDLLPDGHAVKAGDGVLYSIYSMGRMSSIWGNDCRLFKPERWMRAASDGNRTALLEPGPTPSPFQYPVFNAGPRLCLGKALAYHQMKAAAASILSRFRVALLHPDRPVTPRVSITLYIKQGLHVTVSPRDT